MQLDMLFSSAKTGHLGHILGTGFLGEVVVNQLTPPTPGQIQAWGSVVIQVLVGIVTIWATIRKALQQPQAVVQVPAGTVADAMAAVAAPAAPAAYPTPDGDAR